MPRRLNQDCMSGCPCRQRDIAARLESLHAMAARAGWRLQVGSTGPDPATAPDWIASGTDLIIRRDQHGAARVTAAGHAVAAAADRRAS